MLNWVVVAYAVLVNAIRSRADKEARDAEEWGRKFLLLFGKKQSTTRTPHYGKLTVARARGKATAMTTYNSLTTQLCKTAESRLSWTYLEQWFQVLMSESTPCGLLADLNCCLKHQTRSMRADMLTESRKFECLYTFMGPTDFRDASCYYCADHVPFACIFTIACCVWFATFLRMKAMVSLLMQ